MHIPTLTRSRVHRACLVLALSGAALAAARPAAAQERGAWIVPRGVLRLGFSPLYTNYDQRFAADGAVQPLGFDLSGDSIPVTMLPTMIPAQDALRAITGDSALRLTLGSWQNPLDADIRRFPLSGALGLTNHITLVVNVPIVTSRINDVLAVDTASHQAGWNQALSNSGNATGASDIQALLDGLENAAATIDANIAAGMYGCPASAQCDQARALVVRARNVRDNLTLMTGVLPSNVQTTATLGPPPPFAPLATSPAGLALTQAIADLKTQLASFGAAAVTGSLPLPANQADSAAVQSVLTDPTFGYGVEPLKLRRRTSLGDMEVGLRFGLLDRPALRAVLSTTVRLPTGTRDIPNNFIDLGTGDRQTDVQAGLDVAWEPGALGLWLSASYTAQLPDQLSLRVTPPHSPIAPADLLRTVSRDLGDVVQVSASPLVRLTDAVRVYGSASYLHKGSDVFTDPAALDLAIGAYPASVMNLDTGWETWSFGAGISYRAVRTQTANKLPIEAGLSYLSVFSGSGGFTPRSTSLNLYLRLFYQVFGGAAEPEAVTTPGQ